MDGFCQERAASAHGLGPKKPRQNHGIAVDSFKYDAEGNQLQLTILRVGRREEGRGSTGRVPDAGIVHRGALEKVGAAPVPV